MVIDLGLPIRHLPKPVPVSVALQDSQKDIIELSDYVMLSLSSVNNTWSFHSVHAIIAPSLCTSILLGLP